MSKQTKRRRLKRLTKRRRARNYKTRIGRIDRVRRSKKLQGGMVDWLVENTLHKGVNYAKQKGTAYVTSKVGDKFSRGLDYVQGEIGVNFAEKYEGLKGSISSRADQITANVNKDAMRAMAKDQKKWEMFGKGGETARKDFLQLIDSEFSNEMIAQKSKMYYNDGTRIFMDAMFQVATKPKMELLHNMTVKNFADFKDKLDVADGLSYKTFEQHMKEDHNDERDLEQCHYFGGVDKNSQKHEVASFCMPEIVEHGEPNKIDLICFNLKELQLYVQEQKALGVKMIPTYMFNEIKERLPNSDVQPFMSKLWIEAVEYYPTFDNTDIFIMTIIRMLHHYATEHIPYMKEVLSYTEAIGSTVASYTPEWVKKVLKKGKVSIIYFMKSPRVMQTAILVSKFFRLVCCVWISTWGMENPAMTFVNIATVLIEAAGPLAQADPIFTLPYAGLKVILKGGKVVGKLMNLDILGAVVAICELVWESKHAVFSTFGFTISTTVCLPFKLIAGWDVEKINMASGNPMDWMLSTANSVGTWFTGKKETFGKESISYQLANIEEKWINELKENFSDWLTMCFVSFIPPWIVNKVLLLLVTGVAGPAGATAFLAISNFVELFYPGQNIVLVIFTAVQRKGTLVDHVMKNVYPFKDMMLIYSVLHEIFLWVSEVGKCGMKRIYDDYVGPVWEGSKFKPLTKKSDYAECCMSEQVKKIKLLVEEGAKRVQAEKDAAAKKAEGEALLKKNAAAEKAQAANIAEKVKSLEGTEAELTTLKEKEQKLNKDIEEAVKNGKTEIAAEKKAELEKVKSDIHGAETNVETEEQKLDREVKTMFNNKVIFIESLITSCLNKQICMDLSQYFINAKDAKDSTLLETKMKTLFGDVDSIDYGYYSKHTDFNHFVDKLVHLFNNKDLIEQFQALITKLLREVNNILNIEVKQLGNNTKIRKTQDQYDKLTPLLDAAQTKLNDAMKLSVNLRNYFEKSYKYEGKANFEKYQHLIDKNRQVITDGKRLKNSTERKWGIKSWKSTISRSLFGKKDASGTDVYNYCDMNPDECIEAANPY